MAGATTEDIENHTLAYHAAAHCQQVQMDMQSKVLVAPLLGVWALKARHGLCNAKAMVVAY